jgi:signal peptidase
LLVTVVVLLAVALVGVRLVGLQPYMVLSGSMEPTYHVGSLVYVKKVDYKQLQVGDPITYMISQDTVVTHRIIEVLVDESDPDILRYFTKGDANDAPDGTSVHYKNIIGKPVFSIPYLGYVANYIQNPPGMYVAIAGGAILMMLVFLPDLFSDEEDKKKDKSHGK